MQNVMLSARCPFMDMNSITWSKTTVTPLLKHWSYCSHALSHQINLNDQYGSRWLCPLLSVGWNYISIPKRQQYKIDIWARISEISPLQCASWNLGLNISMFVIGAPGRPQSVVRIPHWCRQFVHVSDCMLHLILYVPYSVHWWWSRWPVNFHSNSWERLAKCLDYELKHYLELPDSVAIRRPSQ